MKKNCVFADWILKSSASSGGLDRPIFNSSNCAVTFPPLARKPTFRLMFFCVAENTLLQQKWCFSSCPLLVTRMWCDYVWEGTGCCVFVCLTDGERLKTVTARRWQLSALTSSSGVQGCVVTVTTGGGLGEGELSLRLSRPQPRRVSETAGQTWNHQAAVSHPHSTPPRHFGGH